MNTMLHQAHAALLQVGPPRTSQVYANIENPISGVRPSFNFGATFNAWWQQVFAAAWGLVIIICLVYCVMAIAQMRASAGSPMQHQQGKDSLIKSCLALGASIAFGVLVSAIFWVVN